MQVNNEQFKLLLTEHQKLLDQIVLAVNKSIKDNKFDESTPNWRTHKPWQNKVIPNLTRNQDELIRVEKELSAGDDSEVIHMAGVVSGVGKDLDDFNTSWMKSDINKEIEQQVDVVVELADTIRRSTK